jgi:hypothetical protein
MSISQREAVAPCAAEYAPYDHYLIYASMHCRLFSLYHLWTQRHGQAVYLMILTSLSDIA